MGKLAGKVAVVTGASKGIGAEIAKALAKEGARVVVNYASSKKGADDVVSAIMADGGTAIGVKGNVSNAADAERIIAAAIENYGQVDILVNNAGIYDFKPLEQISEDHFHEHFNVNVLGLILVTQAAAKHFRQGASVINISSVASRLTLPGSVVYSGTKGAVDAITGVLARELASRGIRVNAINPGVISTEGTTTAGIIGSDFEAALIQQTPLGRVGQPKDIASVVSFLASDEADFLTGEKIIVSGGLR